MMNETEHWDSITKVNCNRLTHTAGTLEADTVAGVDDGMPRRVALMQRGLTKQQWAALQHEKANKPPRKPLCVQYSPGRLTSGQEDQGLNKPSCCFFCTRLGHACSLTNKNPCFHS